MSKHALLLFIALALCGPAGLLAAAPPAGNAPPQRPLVGAIRWDAWLGGNNKIGQSVESALGPEKWHSRLPIYAKVEGKDRVRIDGTSPEVVEREIEYAIQAGVDYWTFGADSLQSPMAYGLRAYIASKKRDKLKFCLMTSPNCKNFQDPAYAERLVGWMKEPGYLRVLDGRPVLYLLTWYASKENTPEEYRKAFAALRAAVRAGGLPEPYVVMMNTKAAEAKRWVDLGGDAVSSYAIQGGGHNAPYRQLAEHTERFWDECKATGAQVVPVVMSGWDRRPRVERPVPWEAEQKPGVGIEQFYQAPKPEELAEHVRHALDWLKANPSSAKAQLAIMYAWNEHDEGGWLAPTLSEGAARLEAIGKVLRP